MPSVSKAFNKIKVRRKWKIHIFCRNLQTTRDNICSKHYCSRYACDVLSLFSAIIFFGWRESNTFVVVVALPIAVIAAVTVVFVVAVIDANFVIVTAAAVASIAAVVVIAIFDATVVVTPLNFVTVAVTAVPFVFC